MPRLIEIILAILVAVLGGVVLVMWPERPGSPAEPEPVETEAPVLPDGEADPGSEPVEPEPGPPDVQPALAQHLEGPVRALNLLNPNRALQMLSQSGLKSLSPSRMARCWMRACKRFSSCRRVISRRRAVSVRPYRSTTCLACASRWRRDKRTPTHKSMVMAAFWARVADNAIRPITAMPGATIFARYAGIQRRCARLGPGIRVRISALQAARMRCTGRSLPMMG